MRQHTTGTTSGWSNSSIITAYRESVAYDANGNILKYLRKGTAATPHMDSLTYKYNYSSGQLVNNKLVYVKDSIPLGNYTVDIDDQANNNYLYDRIGNLRKDVAENIDSIHWTVYGKIRRIKKPGLTKNDPTLEIDYGYDPTGSRSWKKTNDGTTARQTFYVRDAQGNVLAVYSKENSNNLLWKEQHLYGSSRVGMWLPDTTIPAEPPIAIGDNAIQDSLQIGKRNYELTNHLGNVLGTISDKKIGNDSSGVVNYYIAEVLSQTDYYPGGMGQPSRQYAVADYRYGFNGKERDKDISSDAYDYGMRISDHRLGRFLSVDPISDDYPELTPYQFASNSPIRFEDLDGLEAGARMPDGSIFVPAGRDNLGFKYPQGATMMPVCPGCGIMDTKAMMEGLSLILDHVPGISTVKGALEAVVGYDMAGNKLSLEDRLLGLLPYAKDAKKLKGVLELAKATDKTDEVNDLLKAANKLDDVKANKKAIVNLKNKNANDAEGEFILYDVHEKPGRQGKLLKVGKADEERKTATGEVVRMKHSEKAARKQGYPNATATPRKKLGRTTTGKAKDAEAAEVRSERAAGNELPLNKEKDKKYRN